MLEVFTIALCNFGCTYNKHKNRLLSTTERGMRSSATKLTTASVTKICLGFCGLYFLWGCSKCVRVCCDSSSFCSSLKSCVCLSLLKGDTKVGEYSDRTVLLPDASTNL